MKNLKLFSLFAGVALIAMGCSKGSTGPAGPQGPAGPDSVTYSSWTVLNMQYFLDNSDTIYTQTIVAPAITQQILDQGIILTYLDIPDPNTEADNLVNAAVYIEEFYAVDSIYLYSQGVDFSGLKYRYVVVPGTIQDNKIVSGPAAGYTKQQLQNMSYEAVEKLLGTKSKAGAN